MKPTSMRLARGAVPAAAPGALTASGTGGYRALVDAQTASHTFCDGH